MSTTSELLGHLRTALSSEVTTDEAAAALGKLKEGIREIDQFRARVAEMEQKIGEAITHIVNMRAGALYSVSFEDDEVMAASRFVDENRKGQQ